jgi:hypothetical protein
MPHPPASARRFRRSAPRLLWGAALALCAAVPSPSQAQGQPGVQPSVVLGPPTPPVSDAALNAVEQSAGEQLRIYLVTMGPGDEVWEKFGHNAIWVHDPVEGTDQAYNYGMFDFRQAHFYTNFARGRMMYWMQGFDALRTLEFYASQNRTVWVQELNLRPAQRVWVKRFLQWNERDENRFYHYDYYRDNCSTRVRDVIDRVTGGALSSRFGRVATGVTYRWHTERLTADDVTTYTGLMIGLAEPADRPISAWEEMFLPMRLRDYVRKADVPDGHGGTVPLVRSERIATAAVGREPERKAPPQRIPGYLLVGVLIGGVVAGLGWAARRNPAARLGYSVLAVLWTLLTGLGGVVLACLWLFTDHAIAYRNENLLQLDPVSLPLVVLLPALAYGAEWAARSTPRIAVAVAALSVLGFVIQALPGVDQVNGIVIALALPINLALAWTALRLRETASVSAESKTVDAERRTGRGGNATAARGAKREG